MGQEGRNCRRGYSAETKKKSKVWSIADHKACNPDCNKTGDEFI
jgi:hypothetical protein